MVGYEKVLKGLECLSDENNICSKNACPYYMFESCIPEISHDALELLKKQSQCTSVEEAVAPTIREGAEVEKVICCGSCGSALYHLFPWKKISKAREYAQYCRHCGKRVKWDEMNEVNEQMSDILISMNKVSEAMNKLAQEWHEHPEHFEGVNPFYMANWAIRQKKNMPDGDES